MNRDRMRYASFQPAFQANRIMEKIQNDDHVYLDVEITFDDSRESFELSSPASYRTTKTEAILKNPSDYHIVVDRFSIPGYLLPSYVFNPADPGFVRLEYDGNTVTQQLIYIPNSVIPDNVPEYYYMYDYQHWIQMLNTAFATAFASLPSTPVGSNAPYIVWDTDAQKFILYTEEAFYDLALGNPIKIFVNEAIGKLLPFMPYRSFAKETAFPFVDYFQFIIEDYKNNKETINSVDYLFLKQQAIGTGGAWNPVKSLIFTSQSIPVKNTFTQVNEKGQDSNANSLGILIDFKLDISNNALGNRKTLLYVPQQNYRRLDLYGTSPLKTLDVNVYWADERGRLLPVRIPRFENVNIKLLFIRKDISSSANS